MEQNIYDLIQAIGEVAEQAGMTAKEFTNYLEALALNQTVDNRLHCSHAEGRSATASDHYSHAEGAQTRTYGAYTIAEGHRNCDGNALIEHALVLLDDAKLEEGWDWLDHDVD